MSAAAEQLQLQSTDATEVSLSIAGVGSRSYAFLIDWHIRLLLAVAWLAGSGWLLSLLSDINIFRAMFDEAYSATWTFILLVTLPAGLIYFLYHPILEMRQAGRTPGKRLAGVRIVTLEGHTPSAGALLIRNVFRLIDCLPMFYVIGMVVAMMTHRHVRIGDLAAGTVIVYENRGNKRAFELLGKTPAELERQELVTELLARWRSLKPDIRTSLAKKLLGDSDLPAPGVPNDRDVERDLHARLKRLAGHGARHASG